MGIGVSDWRLANAVASIGQMGVVSGTAIDNVLVRRLQLGDPSGLVREAMSFFPKPEAVDRILEKYFVAGGKDPEKPFASLPMMTAKLSMDQQELLAVANFVEVFLAKKNAVGKIGINFLEKIQMVVLPSLYGAILAGVDYVLMGAGIPREIPTALDSLSLNQDSQYRISVLGASKDDNYQISFSPREFMGGRLPDLQRPQFLGVIASNVLATTLAKRIARPVDGFVIEAPTAGGHNAPPRGKGIQNERGEPVYGEKDIVDFAGVAELGLPFWLAGKRGSPEGLRDALKNGAQGVQVGTAFALCEESGLAPEIRRSIISQVQNGNVDVFTDPRSSPTGFPFKLARMEGTNSQIEMYQARTRVCDLGYLREAYKKEDGNLGYRCPAEPVNTYMARGGTLEETVGRKCLCNGLMANIGLAQSRKDGSTELPLVTIGDDVNSITQFLKDGGTSYTAQDVIDTLSLGLVGNEKGTPRPQNQDVFV